MGFFGFSKLGGTAVKEIPVELIDPNPSQPRRVFDSRAIEELAASIKENGLLSPVAVRRIGVRYQLIAGERRVMAFRMLGESTIPAILENVDDKRSATLAIVENLQRRNLNFYEEAKAMETLIKAQGITQIQAAERLGISQSAVANKLRLLRLPTEQVMKLIKAELTERHARALLPLAEDERIYGAVEKIIRERLNVSQTEKLVKSIITPKAAPRRGGRILILKDLRLFTSAIGRAVDMMKQAGIDTVCEKQESDSVITYTITIPKTKKAAVPHICSQTPPYSEAL